MTGLDLAPIEGRLDAAYDDGSWTDPDLGAFINDVGALLAEVKELRAQLDRIREYAAWLTDRDEITDRDFWSTETAGILRSALGEAS